MPRFLSRFSIKYCSRYLGNMIPINKTRQFLDAFHRFCHNCSSSSRTNTANLNLDLDILKIQLGSADHLNLNGQVFNLNGILLFALFITLTLAVLGPFQCLANPDGSSSMAANPGHPTGAAVWIGILCFKNWIVPIRAINHHEPS